MKKSDTLEMKDTDLSLHFIIFQSYNDIFYHKWVGRREIKIIFYTAHNVKIILKKSYYLWSIIKKHFIYMHNFSTYYQYFKE